MRGLAAEDQRGCARRRPCRAPCRPAGRGPRAPAPARCAARGRRARRAGARCLVARGRARRHARARRPRGASPLGVPQVAHRVGIERAAGRGAMPKRLRPKRAPSSSAQSTSVTVHGGVPAAASERSVSSAAITPSAPSSQPPFGTESMCEPMTTVSGARAVEARPDVAGLVDVDLDRQLVEGLAHAGRARSPTPPSSRAAARRPGRRSGRPARADRRSPAAADSRSPRPSPRTGG